VIEGATDGAQRLRAGMFLQVRVPVEAPAPRIVVPATAVRRTTYGDNVWIVSPGDTAKDPHDLRASMRPVRLGPAIGEDIIILDGLKAGERIATTGSFKLREGAKVIDADNPPPPPPGMGPDASH
jgi:membrane fusion protein (multidrug efflux system)